MPARNTQATDFDALPGSIAFYDTSTSAVRPRRFVQANRLKCNRMSLNDSTTQVR